MSNYVPDHSTEPLQQALSMVDDYIKRGEFDPVHEPVVKQIRTRLARLSDEYNELMSLNTQLDDTDPLRQPIHFDPATDTLTIGSGEHAIRLKFNRADPDTPISQVGTSSVSAYDSGKGEDASEARLALMSRMESLIEGYYYNAYRVIRLSEELFGKRKTRNKTRRVMIVRNKLIEHADSGSIYSFGYSDKGPVVKPMKRTGESTYIDEGLVPNTDEFSAMLISCFS